MVRGTTDSKTRNENIVVISDSVKGASDQTDNTADFKGKGAGSNTLEKVFSYKQLE